MLDVKYYCFEKNNQKHVLAVFQDGRGVFKGEAICSSEDTYDEEFGKKLAYNKCIKSLRKYKIRDLKAQLKWSTDLAEYYSNKSRQLSNDLANLIATYQNNLLDIEEMSNGVEKV